MQYLRKRLRINSPVLRDRLGIACGLGAVVCLSSLIAGWSNEYPLACDETVLGDLRNNDGRKQDVSSITERISTSVGSELGSSFGQINNSSADPSVSGSFSSQLAVPIGERPPEHQPRFIQPTEFRESAESPSVWLSGVIELAPEEIASPQTASEPVNRL